MKTDFYTTVIKRKNKKTGEYRYQAQIRPKNATSPIPAESKTFDEKDEAESFIAEYLKQHKNSRKGKRLEVPIDTTKADARPIKTRDVTVAQALFIYAKQVACVQKNRKDQFYRINRFLRAAGMDEIDPASPKGTVRAKQTTDRTQSNGSRTAAQLRQTRQKNGLMIEHHIAEVANLPITDLGAHDIERFKLCNKSLNEPLSPSTINHFINLLRSLIKIAKKSWHWDELDFDVYHNSSLLPVPKCPKPVLPPENFIALIEYAKAKVKNPHFLPFVLLSALLGTRFSELGHQLTWGDVDLQRNLIYLTPDQSKAAAHERVVITEEVKAVLLSLASAGEQSGPLFGVTYDSMRGCLKRAWDALGLPQYGFHTFRHTAITDESAYNGGDVAKTQLFSRHNTVTVVMHYTHTNFDEYATEKRGRFSSEPVKPPKYPRVQEIAKNAALGYPLDFRFSPEHPFPPSAEVALSAADKVTSSNVVALDLARKRAS